MTSLQELRGHIDKIDQEIIHLLGRRAKFVHEIGLLKNSDEEIEAKERQEQVYTTRRTWAVEEDLDPDFVEQLYRQMIAYFIEREREILKGKNQP